MYVCMYDNFSKPDFWREKNLTREKLYPNRVHIDLSTDQLVLSSFKDIASKENKSVSYYLTELMMQEINRKKVEGSHNPLTNYIEENSEFKISWKKVLSKKEAKELLLNIPDNGRATAIRNANTIWISREGTLNKYQQRELMS